jgi:hypothetical protein
MKKIKITYWITTVLFAGFMIFSAVPSIIGSADAVQFIMHLGYPEYFIPFLGVAKVLGSIAILVPAFRKIKEWAYAGLFFDLMAAVYSVVAVDGFNSGILFIVVLMAVAITSYVLNESVHGSAYAAGKEVSVS